MKNCSFPALLFCIAMTGCFTEFPGGVASDGEVHRFPPDSGTSDVLSPDPDDGVLRPDSSRPPPRDAGGPPRDADGPPRDADPNRCDELVVTTNSVHIRSWDQPDVIAQSAIMVRGMDCPGAVAVAEVEWLEIDVQVPRSQIVVRAKRAALASGRHRGSVQLRLGQQQVDIPVTVDLYRPPEDGATRHVLVFGLDGFRSGAIEAADTPTLDWLIEKGAYAPQATTQRGVNASAAGWASFFSGVTGEKHKVDGENFGGFDPEFASFVSRVAAIVRSRDGLVAFAHNLQPLRDVFHTPNDLDLTFDGEGSPRQLANALVADPVQLAFVHLFAVDEAGLANAHDPNNPAYRAAVERTDSTISDLLGAVLSRPTLPSEDWLFVFSADSGGGNDAGGAEIPLLVAGPSVAPEALADGSHLDVHPTILRFLGVPLDGRLDGRAIGSPAPPAERCGDNRDNDGDGAVDCDDPDCAADPDCQEPEPEICDNQQDDDGDGDVDCDDDDCADTNVCGELACAAESIGQRTGLAVAEVSTNDAEDWLAPTCGQGVGPERVVHFTAPNAGDYVFNTVGSDYDTLISLREGTCEGLELGCDDDMASVDVVRDSGTATGALSLVRRAMQPGETVAVALGGFRGETGEAVLNIHPFECTGTEIVYRPPPRPPGNILPFEGDNTNAPTLLGSPCAGSAHERLYRFEVPRSGVWQIDTLDSQIDTVLTLYDQTCTEVTTCADQGNYNGVIREQAGVIGELRAGDVRIIAVAGKEGAEGPFRLRVRFVSNPPD